MAMVPSFLKPLYIIYNFRITAHLPWHGKFFLIMVFTMGPNKNQDVCGFLVKLYCQLAHRHTKYWGLILHLPAFLEFWEPALSIFILVYILETFLSQLYMQWKLTGISMLHSLFVSVTLSLLLKVRYNSESQALNLVIHFLGWCQVAEVANNLLYMCDYQHQWQHRKFITCFCTGKNPSLWPLIRRKHWSQRTYKAYSLVVFRDQLKN